MAYSGESLRIALIGKTGVGKSALGNTLVGRAAFESGPSGESCTKFCDKSSGELKSGRKITVVDTPGIMDTTNEDVREEVTKAIAYLSPGPHAFIIVLQPNRATEEERKVLFELQNLFGDENFLQHTIIVMVRKNDLEDKTGAPIDIHTFIKTLAADDVKKLYERCGRRIVAVENKGPESNRQQCAEEVIDEVVKMGGFYSHAYFQLLQDHKALQRKIEQQEQLKSEDIRALKDAIKKQSKSGCIIL